MSKVFNLINIKKVQSDCKKEEKRFLVYTYRTVLLSRASESVKYLNFTLTGKFAGLLIVKQVPC